MYNDDPSRYNTAQVAAMFQISLETVRIWCSEFERHLSPRANPGHRQKRAFSQADLEVFTLVAMLKTDGMTYQDIHAALDNGQRGVPPQTPFEPVEGLVKLESDRQLMLQVQQLETQLEAIVEENEQLKAELDDTKRDNLRHEVRAEMLQELLQKTEERVKELLEERARLDREIGSMQSDLRRHQKDDED